VLSLSPASRGAAGNPPAAPRPLATVWPGLLGTYTAELTLRAAPALTAAATALTFAMPLSPAVLAPAAIAAASLAALCAFHLCAHAAWVRLSVRPRARAAGYRALLLCPECPALARALHARVGIRMPRAPAVFSVHVDTAWRARPGESPADARRRFLAEYRADWDAVLRAAEGRAAVLCLSSFNLAATPGMAGRMAAAVPGPLFPWQPRRHGPRARAAEQIRMFGGVVSARRVDHPSAWETRIFCGGQSGPRP